MRLPCHPLRRLLFASTTCLEFAMFFFQDCWRCGCGSNHHEYGTTTCLAWFPKTHTCLNKPTKERARNKRNKAQGTGHRAQGTRNKFSKIQWFSVKDQAQMIKATSTMTTTCTPTTCTNNDNHHHPHLRLTKLAHNLLVVTHTSSLNEFL